MILKWFKSLIHKPKYKLGDFSKRRVIHDQTQVYHQPSGEWLYWKLIVLSVRDEDGAFVSDDDLISNCSEVKSAQYTSNTSVQNCVDTSVTAAQEANLQLDHSDSVNSDLNTSSGSFSGSDSSCD